MDQQKREKALQDKDLSIKPPVVEHLHGMQGGRNTK
jgi:hypothetical protein